MSNEKPKPNGKTTQDNEEENRRENERNKEDNNDERRAADNQSADYNQQNSTSEDSKDTAAVNDTFSNEKSTQLSQQSPEQNNTTARRSTFFVLHTEKGNVSVNRRCHLPRTKGVNVEARRKLIVASILCLLFVLCEIIGGLISNSLAVAADAAHTLTDFAGFMISLFAIWLAGRKSTDRLSFGWYRAEVIGALASVMTIWFVTAILVYLAIERCISKEFEINAVVMMITAVFGILTNIILGVYLSFGTSAVDMNCKSKEILLPNGQAHNQAHGVHHGHQHLHHQHHQHGFGVIAKLMNCFKFKKKPQTLNSSDDAIIKPERYQHPENINVKAAFLHVVGDGLQSLGVLIAALIIYFRPSWVLADPICTFLFSAIILYTTFKILKEIILVLMEGTPTYMDYNAVQSVFEGIPGIKSTHHLRVWALSLDKIALAVHLVIERGYDPHEILLKAEEAIHTHYNLFETTIQIEEEGYERPTVMD